MKRKVIVIIIVFIVIALIIISSWLIYKKYFKTATGDLESTPFPDYSGGGYSSGGGGYSPASFPVKNGMNGSTVMDIQSAINKKCKSNLVVDGAFGPKTQTALQSCYGVTTVSESLYTQMKLNTVPVNGSPVNISTTGFTSGNLIYLKSSVANIYTYPSFDTNYIAGSVDKNFFLDKPIGKYVSPATNGFVKITVFGYKPYGATTYKVETKDVYISANSISKTAY